MAQRTNDDEGEQREQHKTKHDAEFLSRDRKHKVGMAFGQDAFDRAFARPPPKPSAARKRFKRDADVETVARTRIDETFDPARHIGNGEISSREPGRGRRRKPRDPHQPHPRHEEQRAPDQQDQHGLAEIRLQYHQAHDQKQQRERNQIRRHFRPPCGFAEQPRDHDHKSRFEKLGRLNAESEQHDPAARALHLGSIQQRRCNQNQTHHEHQHRQSADLAERQQRSSQQDRDGRDQIHHLSPSGEYSVREAIRNPPSSAQRPRACPQARETPSRAPQSWDTGRTTRRPATREPPVP